VNHAPQPQTQADLGPALESLLTRLLTEHERLLTHTAAHRTAIARADTTGIEAAVADQRLTTDLIARLETQRQQLIAGYVGGGAPSRPSSAAGYVGAPSRLPIGAPSRPSPPHPVTPPTLSALAEQLPEPARTRVLALSSRLRDTISKVRREHGVIRAATESLLAHMEGLVAQISRRLSRTGVYNPQGAVQAGQQVVSALDLTH
jgi:hypothetical protein